MITDISDILNGCTALVLSNPLKKGNCAGIADCIKVRIRKIPGERFFAEFFTQTQVFHRTFKTEDFRLFAQTLPHTDDTLWRQCLIISDKKEIRVLTNKRGKSTVLTKLKPDNGENAFGFNRQKNYIIAENRPVPFLTALGIMNADGKVLAKKYAKFRQINRFLEYIDDVLSDLTADGAGTERPLNITDFGCGKSYLTFAVYHFLTAIKGLQAHIIGLDLKAGVIEDCRTLAETLGLCGLDFKVQDVRTYKVSDEKPVDMVISLHACDTATDYALAFALTHGARIILCAPCCQHELNAHIDLGETGRPFTALMHYGIIKERFSALATDVMRAELVKKRGYAVDICEFIDTEHTAKNLLIRAVRRTKSSSPNVRQDGSYEDLCRALGARITLEKLIAYL
ncbi:class I SAM-dependent methyltransferase [Treponema sp. OMZ 840]|uniref:class I SAM-dependent methyltransferase n=1 Tax=Treponema sp. OMZ 840 TaxID=244313 RepID=UPI003D89ED9C